MHRQGWQTWKRLWPMLLLPHAAGDTTMPPEHQLELQWCWREKHLAILHRVCAVSAPEERRALLPETEDMQLVELLGSWCEAVEKQDCGTARGLQAATNVSG